MPFMMSTPQNGMNRPGWRSAIAATSSFGIVTLPAVEVSSNPVMSERSMPASSSVFITTSSSTARPACIARTVSIVAGCFQNTFR